MSFPVSAFNVFDYGIHGQVPPGQEDIQEFDDVLTAQHVDVNEVNPTLSEQEKHGQHDHRDVVMPGGPSASLIVVHAE